MTAATVTMICLLAATSVFGGEAAPGKSDEPMLWTPADGRTLADWTSTLGMDDETFAKTRVAAVQCKVLQLQRAGRKVTLADIAAMDAGLGGSLPTPDQASRCLLGQHRRRWRRAIWDFTWKPKLRWSQPIHYKYSGTQDGDDVTMIEAAIKHWEQMTCIRFKKLEINEVFSDQHLLFTNTTKGCGSYIGRVGVGVCFPQMINLETGGCTSMLGRVVHEIGHAIGLWHQHVRRDRDLYVTVQTDNVLRSAMSNFDVIAPHYAVTTLGVAYDYSSVLHYGQEDHTKAVGSLTLMTNNPLYQDSLGQRVKLTFADAQLGNLAYCADACSDYKKLHCHNKGYQDPNNCLVCRCPDGLGGTLCDRVAPAIGGCAPAASSEIDLSSADELCFSSRGFDAGSPYRHGDTCSLLINAPRGCTIDVRFDGQFGVFKSIPKLACNHWVELKYKADLSLGGPRFCGYTPPSFDHVTSETNRMLISFNAQHPLTSNRFTQQPTDSDLQGFRLCYRLTNPKCMKSNRGKKPRRW